MKKLIRMVVYLAWIVSSAYGLYGLSRERDFLNIQIGKLEQKLDFSVRGEVDDSGEPELRSMLASSMRSLASHNRACRWTLVSLAIAMIVFLSEFTRREGSKRVQSAGDDPSAIRPGSGSEGGEESPTDSNARLK